MPNMTNMSASGWTFQNTDETDHRGQPFLPLRQSSQLYPHPGCLTHTHYSHQDQKAIWSGHIWHRNYWTHTRYIQRRSNFEARKQNFGKWKEIDWHHKPPWVRFQSLWHKIEWHFKPTCNNAPSQQGPLCQNHWSDGTKILCCGRNLRKTHSHCVQPPTHSWSPTPWTPTWN